MRGAQGKHGEAHLGDRVHAVGSRRRVGAQAHGDAGTAHLGDACQTLAELGASARRHGNAHAVVAQKLDVVVLKLDAMDGEQLRHVEDVPVERILHRRATGRQQLHRLARGECLVVGGVVGDGEHRRAIADEVALLLRAGQVHGHGRAGGVCKVRDLLEDLGMAAEEVLGGDADLDAVGVGNLAAPLPDLLDGAPHLLLDLLAGGRTDAAVHDTAQAQLGDGGQACTRGGDVGHAGDAGGKGLVGADVGGVEPVLDGEQGHLLVDEGLPARIGRVVEDAAHERELQVRVAVHETRHDGCHTEVADLLAGMARHEVGSGSDLDDAVALDEHGAVLDVGVKRAGHGNHIAGCEQHRTGPPVV